MVRKMSKVQAFANNSGNERRAQVKMAIGLFLEKDEIRRAFEAFVPKKSLMIQLAPVTVGRERIGGKSVTRFGYGGRQ